jgi:prolyl oligopeptidase
MSFRTRWVLVCSLAVALAIGCGAPPTPVVAPADEVDASVGAAVEPAPSRDWGYPETRVDDTVDTLHGVEIADPYRWLEDDEDAEVKGWQAAQTALAREYLDGIPGREEVRERIAEVFQVDAEGTPARRGKYYFQRKRRADQDQPVLYVSKGFPGKQRVLVDPNALGEGDNTVALDWWYPSWDGKLVAYGLSSSGSERSTLYLVRTKNGKKLGDAIPNTRSSYVAWLPNNKGFFYSRRPDPESGETWFNKVYFHKIGRSWERDELVFAVDSDDAIHYPLTSPDGKRLVIQVFRGAGGADIELYYRAVADRKGELAPVAVGKDAAFHADVKNDKLVVLTNYEAPRYRVLEIEYDSLDESHWREIVPEGEDTIDQILLIKDHMVVKVMHHAVDKLYLHRSTGERLREIELPTLGTVWQLRGRFEDEEFFYGFSSFVYAGDIYRHRLGSESSELVSRIEVPVDPERYVIEQVFYESKDGTRVPMFVSRLEDGGDDGPRPAMLSGYGGFNVAITPYFLGRFLPYIEAGGVFAVPNLRGGSEYGEEWHRAGMLENKQNVFDDFIAAAEHLIAEGITTPGQLTIRGGSNGGLLVGAAMVQKPELFGAVICAVPLLDMLRYHNFLIARLWVPEYGSADDEGQFEYLRAYSPYHNAKDGARYPATLLLTAESDSRVAPLHARKFAALLQARTGGDAPIFLHVEAKAGHGQGKPISKRIDDVTDYVAFAMHQTGLLD